jgi:hypothetical protein
MRDPSHNSGFGSAAPDRANNVDFSQRTAPPEMGGDEAEQAAQMLQRMFPHAATWNNPTLRKRWMDLFRDSQAGISTSPEENARLKQSSPEEDESVLTRQAQDKFFTGDTMERWRKDHFGKL